MNFQVTANITAHNFGPHKFDPPFKLLAGRQYRIDIMDGKPVVVDVLDVTLYGQCFWDKDGNRVDPTKVKLKIVPCEVTSEG